LSAVDGEAMARMRRRVFFREGLRFSCQRCGACCTGAPGTVYFTLGEVEALAGAQGRSVEALLGEKFYPYRDGYSAREYEDGRCVFFAAGCTIYEQRPAQCRTFPFWLKILRSEERWRALAEQCPGVDQGEVHDYEAILRIVGESPL